LYDEDYFWIVNRSKLNDRIAGAERPHLRSKNNFEFHLLSAFVYGIFDGWFMGTHSTSSGQAPVLIKNEELRINREPENMNKD